VPGCLGGRVRGGTAGSGLALATPRFGDVALLRWTDGKPRATWWRGCVLEEGRRREESGWTGAADIRAMVVGEKQAVVG